MKPTTYPISLGPGLSMRPVEPADIEASHLLNLPPPVPTVVYRWLYFDNPFRNGRPTGWVVVHDDHGIVGKIWLIWWPARFLGEPIECVMGGDLFVDPRLRGAEPGSRWFVISSSRSPRGSSSDRAPTRTRWGCGGSSRDSP